MRRTKFCKVILYFFVPILSILAMPLNATNTKWVVKPQYEKIYHYSGEYYKCRMADGTTRIISSQTGKCITDDSGKGFILSQSDSLTYPVNGLALVISLSYSGNNVLKGIFNVESAQVKVLSDDTYFVANGGYFSEDLICVKNKRGKFGYLGPDGREVVKCQFQEAHPFSEGFASVVMKGYYVMYITKTWDADHTPLTIPFRNGDIAFGSSFKNGTAVVGYDNDCAYIDRTGNVKKPYIPSSLGIFVDEYDYSITSGAQKSIDPAHYVDDRKLTYQQDIPIQACSFSDFLDGKAIVRNVDGKYGIVEQCPGDFMVELEESIIPVYLGKTPQAVLNVSNTGTLCNYSFQLIENGMVRSASIEGGKVRADVSPDNGNEGVIAYQISSDGLVQARGECPFVLSFPVSMVLESAPHAVGERADASDIQNVSAKFINNTAIRITAVVTMSITPGYSGASTSSVSRTIEMESGETCTFSNGFKVKNDMSAMARLIVSVDDEVVLSASNQINLKSFY